MPRTWRRALLQRRRALRPPRPCAMHTLSGGPSVSTRLLPTLLSCVLRCIGLRWLMLGLGWLPLLTASTWRPVRTLRRGSALLLPWCGLVLLVFGRPSCSTPLARATRTASGHRAGPWPPHCYVGHSYVPPSTVALDRYSVGSVLLVGCSLLGHISSTIYWRYWLRTRACFVMARALPVAAGYPWMPGTTCWCLARGSHLGCP